MSDYIGTVTNLGLAKIAAAIGGTALNLTTIRVGDGNGVPITPNPTMTDLVRRVGVAYPIISSGRDPVNANHWRVTALIPVEDGPFDIREIGVWDVAGEMVAIARHVLVEKRTPAQGAAVELLTDIVFPVVETAQVTVQVQPQAQVSIFQMLRAGFCTVASAQLADPPGAPVLGRTHVVAADPTGAWAGRAGDLVQWNGIVWVAVTPQPGFVVVAEDRAIDHPQRFLRRTDAGWTSAMASKTSVGVTRLTTADEFAALVDDKPSTARQAALLTRSQDLNFLIADGTASDITVALVAPPGDLADVTGWPFRILTGDAANPGPVTLKLGGFDAAPVRGADGLDLLKGELPPFTLLDVAFNGAWFQIINRQVPFAARAPGAFRMVANAGQNISSSTTTVVNWLQLVRNGTIDSVFTQTTVTIGARDRGWWLFAGRPFYSFSGSILTNSYIERNGAEIGSGNAPGSSSIRARPLSVAIEWIDEGDEIRLTTTSDTTTTLTVTGGAAFLSGGKIGV